MFARIHRWSFCPRGVLPGVGPCLSSRRGARRSRLPVALLAFFALSAALLAGCDQRLPSDPAAQVVEIRRRMDAVTTSKEKSLWLIHAGDNPTTAARDLLLENLNAPHLLLSAASSEILRIRWVKDPQTRRLLRDYYLDPTRSFRNRETLYSFLIERFRDTYPEFADLTQPPPTFPGRVHIRPIEEKEGGL